MKRLGWFWILGIGAVLVMAVVMAGQLGEKSPAMVRGRVILADSLKEKVIGPKTLFLIVAGNDRPMPFGAFRKTVELGGSQEVIFEFVLTYENLQRMRADEAWPDPFRLKARLDSDGVAGPDQPGDFVGEVVSLKPGSEGVELVIDREISG